MSDSKIIWIKKNKQRKFYLAVPDRLTRCLLLEVRGRYQYKKLNRHFSSKEISQVLLGQFAEHAFTFGIVSKHLIQTGKQPYYRLANSHILHTVKHPYIHWQEALYRQVSSHRIDCAIHTGDETY